MSLDRQTVMVIAFYISLVYTVIFVPNSGHAQIDPDTIVGAWLFDEGKGKVAEDLSGGQHHGKLEKGPKWVKGQSGQALEFDGGNYVELEDSAPDLHFGGVEPFTISVWVNPQPGGTIIGKFNGGVIGAYILEVLGGSSVMFHREVAPWGLSANKIVPPKDKFSHITATYDGLEMKVYVNGELSGQQQRLGQNKDVATPVLVGARFQASKPSNFYTGIIDDLALFNVALGEAEIQRLIAPGLPSILGLIVEPEDRLATAWATLKLGRQ